MLLRADTGPKQTTTGTGLSIKKKSIPKKNVKTENVSPPGAVVDRLQIKVEVDHNDRDLKLR